MFVLHEGKLVKRMKVPGPVSGAVRLRAGERYIRNHITAVTWRGVSEGICSGHSDGQIRAWIPEMAHDEHSDTEESCEAGRAVEETVLKRKRQVLDDVFRGLTKQKITFS